MRAYETEVGPFGRKGRNKSFSKLRYQNKGCVEDSNRHPQDLNADVLLIDLHVRQT